MDDSKTSAVETRAVLSPCRRYRYALWRRWESGPQVLFVMLNPSTADKLTDDPTIRRCIGFARSWGFGSLAVGNLFAYRTTYPDALCASSDPVGFENDRWLRLLHEESPLTIAAWGNHGRLLGRSSAVSSKLPGLHILGLTVLGEPRHPLYVRSTVVPRHWTAPNR